MLAHEQTMFIKMWPREYDFCVSIKYKLSTKKDFLEIKKLFLGKIILLKYTNALTYVLVITLLHRILQYYCVKK